MRVRNPLSIAPGDSKETAHGKASIETTHRDLSTEKFFYFFMGPRKGRIRMQVQMMQACYPDDDPERLAKPLSPPRQRSRSWVAP